MKDIQKTVYPNGFHFVHQKSLHKLPLCTIHLFCDIGSSFETDELRGIAHFLEHLLFQGTKKRTPKMLFQEYDRIGTVFNAYTTKRFTCFYVKCHVQHAQRIIDLYTDVMQNSSFTEETVKNERKIIEQETRNMLNDYGRIAQLNFDHLLYKNSSFEYPIDDISFKQNRKNITHKTLRKWYEWFYQPSNLVLSVVSSESDHFWKKILFKSSLTKPNFRKNVDKPNRALDFPVQNNIPYTTNIDIITTTEKGTVNTQLIVGFRTVNQYSDKKYIFELLSNVLNGMSGRLFTLLRQNANIVYGASAISEEEEFTGYFSVSTECEDKNLRKVLSIVLLMFKNISTEGVTEEEFHIAKSRIRGHYHVLCENSNTLAKHNGYEHLVFVRDTDNSRHYKKSNIIPFQKILETHIKNITIEQLNALAREYFRKTNLIISVVSSNDVDAKELRKFCNKIFI